MHPTLTATVPHWVSTMWHQHHTASLVVAAFLLGAAAMVVLVARMLAKLWHVAIALVLAALVAGGGSVAILGHHVHL